MAHVLIYGGTFDPVHHGHLIPCRAAREALGADQALFIPAWVSPHKKGELPRASGVQRLRMLELAIQGEAGFAVDARELHRGGASYTIDTLGELERERAGDQFTLLVGEDQLPKLHTWHRIDAILGMARMAVMGRPSAAQAGMAEVRRHLGPLADRLTLLSTPRLEISASEIRRRVASGAPISFFLPPAVEEYVKAERLYR